MVPAVQQVAAENPLPASRGLTDTVTLDLRVYDGTFEASHHEAYVLAGLTGNNVTVLDLVADVNTALTGTGVQAVFDAFHRAGLTYFPRISHAKVVCFKKGF